ncbi:hypothetical protein AAVH_05379 [Aphelenchoides avenae]|nr:hypothetical protein AAVH_05379 [Aphelenchus avenae]
MDPYEELLDLIRSHRVLSMVLLFVQFIFGTSCGCLSAPQIATNAATLFILYNKLRCSDKQEIVRLKVEWKQKRIHCIARIFMLTFLAFLRLCLLRVAPDVPSVIHGSSASGTLVHFIYYLNFLVSFSDNWLLLCFASTAAATSSNVINVLRRSRRFRRRSAHAG